MTKRAAMLIAAGLVAALAVGATALSFGLAGNGPAQAETKDRKPIVRTVRRTITVEKPAKKADQPVRVVQLSSGSAASPISTDGLQAGSSEHEGFEDDGFEGEGFEHESEEHGDRSDEHAEGAEDPGDDD